MGCTAKFCCCCCCWWLWKEVVCCHFLFFLFLALSFSCCHRPAIAIAIVLQGTNSFEFSSWSWTERHQHHQQHQQPQQLWQSHSKRKIQLAERRRFKKMKKRANDWRTGTAQNETTGSVIQTETDGRQTGRTTPPPPIQSTIWSRQQLLQQQQHQLYVHSPKSNTLTHICTHTHKHTLAFTRHTFFAECWLIPFWEGRSL